MLIIEGKVGKSVILENMLKNRKQQHGNTGDYLEFIHDNVVIDYVGVPSLSEYTSHYCTNSENMKVEDVCNDFIKACGSFKNFKTIIFQVNAPKEMIKEFKKLDNKFNHEFIVTIQNRELEDVRVYEM